MRLGLFLLFLGILPCSALGAPQPVEKVSIDFLYVNANAGEAAGGHTALRLGNTIYHYQFFPDSTFLLVKDHWSSFYFLYNQLHNRTISIGSVAIDQASFSTIKHHFNELLIEQQQFFNALQKLRNQVELSKAMATGTGSVAIAGLGFFTPSTETQPNTTRQLRQIITTKLGPNSLKPSAKNSASLTLLETISWQEALKILQSDFSLAANTIIAPMPEEPSLNTTEQHQLERFHQKQLHSILALLQSSRPGRGEALLLQIARYLVVHQSIQAKRLYTLDPFPDDAKTVRVNNLEPGQSLALIQTQLFQQSQQRASLFFKEKTHPEIAYSLLETSRARLAELSQAGVRRQEVRLLPKVKLPSRSKHISLQSFSAEIIHGQPTTQDLEARLQALEKKVKTKYNYNLFYKNCATELVRALNTSFTNAETGSQKLGGWMEPNDGLVFIPFLLYDKSITSYAIQEEQILTSRRLRQLEQLYARENDLLVWLRESNTLSSTLYTPRSKDTYFLFFTDDSLLLRPVQGILNLGYATLHGVAGLFTLPFDAGERIHQAGRGFFYSLPEIAFCNIRKGSYATGDSYPKQDLTQ